MRERPRLASCVAEWPDAEEGEYNPACCRFPKSCSATVYPDDIDPSLLEIQVEYKTKPRVPTPLEKIRKEMDRRDQFINMLTPSPNSAESELSIRRTCDRLIRRILEES